MTQTRHPGLIVLLASVAALVGAPAGAGERAGARLELVSRIAVEGPLSSVALHDGAVWVSLGTEGIVRLDQSGKRVAHLRPGGAVVALATGFGSVWALDVFGDRLLRLDPETNSVAAAIPVRGLPTGLAVAHGSIWVASQLESTLSRIDPATGSELATVRFGEGELWPGGIAATRDGVWVVSGGGNAVSRIDPAGTSVTAVLSVRGARTLAPARNGVWVGRAGRLPLLRIERNRPVVTAALPGRGGDGFGPSLAANGSLWVAYAGSVARLDPLSGALQAELQLPRPQHLSAIATGRDVWIADQTADAVLRLRNPSAPARKAAAPITHHGREGSHR